MSEVDTSQQGTTSGPARFILGLGGLAAAIASIFGVYQMLFPGPPATAGGELSGVTIDSGSGEVFVNFEATIEGYSDQRCTVRWTLYDANTRAVFPDSDFQDQYATDITPSRNKDEGTAQFRVPDPGRSGTYYVRLRLLPPGESGENMALDEVNSEVFTSGTAPAEQDLAKQVTDLQKELDAQQQDQEETNQTPEPSESGTNADIKNQATAPAEASEGIVVVSPEFDAAAATTEEAAVINAAITYYQYAEIGDYYTTHSLLSTDDQVLYPVDTWVEANTNLDTAAGEYVVTDAYPSDIGNGYPTYAVMLTVYLPDGSSAPRTTYFVDEGNGYWAHWLTEEEMGLFNDAL